MHNERKNILNNAFEECAESVLFAQARVQQRHVIKQPLGKQATLFGDDGDVKYLVCDASQKECTDKKELATAGCQRAQQSLVW